MAELHLVGELCGASGFDEHSLFAKWSLSSGSNWKLLEGLCEGQTHLCTGTRIALDELVETKEQNHHWSHPIDVHYMTRGIQGWPRLELQVWAADWLGKCNIAAYGYMSIPTKPGRYKLTCATWMPVGDFRRRLVDSLTGYRMHLVDTSEVLSEGVNRHAIQAQSGGFVQAELSVVLKGFENYGLDL